MSKRKSGNIEAKKVITPKFRASYPYLFEQNEYDGKKSWGITMLFDKKTDLSAMRKAAEAAAEEEWGKDRAKWPRKLKMPFRDGSERADTPGYEGMIFVTASNKKSQPGLVDHARKPILTDDGSFYAGCYARASLLAFTYDFMGKIGVSFALMNVQKLGEGDKFSGNRRAEDEFDAVEEESENPDNYGNTVEAEGDDANW